MDKKTAFIFPGQGAQYVGMGKDFYETFPVFKETLQEADEILGFSLTNLIFEGPAEELTLTKNSQVAIYVVSIGMWRVLKEQMGEMTPDVVAGLSLGEYTALTASGRLSFEDGVRLVRARGLYMHEAGVKFPGTMAVCLGMKLEDVQAAISGVDEVWIANLNCPGQVVISGSIEGVKNASALLKEKGAKRVLPLDVSGAFHSGLMDEARERLKEKIDTISLEESQIDLVMNVPGDYAIDDEIKENMIQQVTSSVLWEKGVRAMEEKGIERYIEIGCGKTLNGMLKKIGVNGEKFSIEKVEDLETLHQGALS